MAKSGEFFKKKEFFFFSSVLLIVVLDQVLKFWVRSKLVLGEVKFNLGFFNLTYVQNTGAGFGVLQGFNLGLIFFSILVIGIIFYYYNQIDVKERLLVFATAFVLGGALGNLIDRISLGHVVDFLSFSFWPAFNVADMAVSIGVIGLVIYYWKK